MIEYDDHGREIARTYASASARAAGSGPQSLHYGSDSLWQVA